MLNVSNKPKVRLKAMPGGPLRSNNDYQFGFYDIGALRHALEHADANGYRIAALPIPRNVFERAHVEAVISHPSVQYAIVDKNKIVACIIDGKEGWMSVLNDMGYHVKGGGKTAKRMKSFHRATLINAHFDHLNIKWVESDEYSRYDFNSGWAEWVTEAKSRLLDGGIVVSSRLIQAGIENLPVYEPHNSLDQAEYYYDPSLKAQLVKHLGYSKVFNGRLFIPEGLLKGQIFVSDNLPDDIDVISSRENLKKEITYSGGYRLLAEPQGPKSRVITDDQTVINLPKLFRKSDMEMWLKEEYEKMFNLATEGKLLTNWKSIMLRNFNRDRQSAEDLEAYARISYVGYRWVAMGLSITHSPWLFETLAVSHAKPLEHRIPIPCAVYEQVIPESLARMIGYDIEVDEGDIRRINDIGVHVVNDFDWLEMYESHGGHDEDDFFKLFYRTIQSGPMDGSKVVIVARSPNGFGEYSIFRYVEDEWYPTWTKADGEVVSFPEVNGRNWPTRLSSAIRENKVSYAGLPSDTNPVNDRPVTEFYSVADVMADVDTAMNGGNVGRYVNACMLHSSTISKHRPVQLCSLESAIDGCTQTSNGDDRLAIDAEASIMIDEVLKSGKPIDYDLWHGRFASLALKHPEVDTYEGKLTQLNKLCADYFDAYCKRVADYAQTHVHPPEIVHQLGQRLYYHAQPLLRQFRMDIFNANSLDNVQSSGSLKREEWEFLYTSIVEYIDKRYTRQQDKYDFILALYSVSTTNPTSSGKVTDQIVLNRIVYPLLEKALQHYGIGNKVIVNVDNGSVKIKEMSPSSWSFTDDDGKLHTFTDPLEYQNFHAQFSPVVFTKANTEAPKRRTKAMF